VKFALRGDNAVMPCIVRGKSKRYSWSIGEAALEDVANHINTVPLDHSWLMAAREVGTCLGDR
jgi:hypothetical protein